MTSVGTAGLAAGDTLAQRYRVTEALEEIGARPGFLGLDTTTDQPVILFPVTEAEADALRPAAGLEHPHLARVLEVVPHRGGHLLVAEHVDGETLASLPGERAARAPLEAIRGALRLLDAVRALHQVGAAHGMLRPAAVALSPRSGEAPRLRFVPPLDPESPDGSGEPPPAVAPSAAEDARSVAALVFEWLAGEPPPPTGLEEADRVPPGVLDPDVHAALAPLLAPDPARRAQDLGALRSALALWFVAMANEAAPRASLSTVPPPLPPAASAPPAPGHAPVAPAAAGRGEVPPNPARRAWLSGGLAAAVGLGLVLALGWGWATTPAPRVEVVLVSASATAGSSAPTVPRVTVGEVAVTGAVDAGLGDRMATCVAGYLPPGAFGRAPSLDWLCSGTDPVAGASRFASAIVIARPHGQVTEAMRLWSQLEWYGLVAYTVIRAGCCPDAAPLVFPATARGCGRFDTALVHIGDDVAAGRDVNASVEAFTQAVRCETRVGRARELGQEGPPTPGGRARLLEYLAELEEP